MANTDPLYCIPGLVAGADLSAKQFHFVKMSADNTVVACDGATDVPIGILQNKPAASGRAATVAAFGVSKVVADETLTYADNVGTSADGQGAVVAAGSDTTVRLVGTVIRGAAAGEYATVAFNCLGAGRGA